MVPRLAHDLGYTPVFWFQHRPPRLRTGRHLASLLDDVTAAWPARIAQVILVGHSMGRLVPRAHVPLCTTEEPLVGIDAAPRLLPRLPHLGARLEQWVAVSAACSPSSTRRSPLASVLDRRSAGVEDLHTGYLLADIGTMPTETEESRW